MYGDLAAKYITENEPPLSILDLSNNFITD